MTEGKPPSPRESTAEQRQRLLGRLGLLAQGKVGRLGLGERAHTGMGLRAGLPLLQVLSSDMEQLIQDSDLVEEAPPPPTNSSVPPHQHKV